MTKKRCKVLIMSNKKWMTITCRIFITNIVKFDQTAFAIQIDALDDADFFFCFFFFVNLRTTFNTFLSK